MRRGLPVESDLEKVPYSLYEGIEYKQFWSGLPKHKQDELEHAILRNLIPVSGTRIIDVGCGYGRLADDYMGRFQQVIMVDGSMSLLRQAYEKTNGQAIYIACDVNHLPFRSAAFDVVLMIRVFHHIENSRGCLYELHRLLSKDGRLVFSYCNKQNARRVISWLARTTTVNPYSTEPVGVGSTFISHHPNAIHKILIETGFSNIHDYGAGVVDWLAGRIGLRGRWIASAVQLAPFFAMSKIAPWIFCQADAKENNNINDAEGITDILQCPSCDSSLSDGQKGYMCRTCKNHYPIENGIIDLRVH
jgi:ubiquinone/menaquinone biosynthesis C-methylase UbiE